MDTQDRWYYNHLHNIHTKKLELIQSKSTGRIDNSIPETFGLSKTKNFSFRTTKKKEIDDIFKKNQIIMDALNEISNRKKRVISDNCFSLESLNLNKRKQDLQKIIRENTKIHKKIVNKGATFSVKKLDEDYKLSLKYKKNLLKKFGDTQKKKEKRKKLPKLGKVGGKNKKKLFEETDQNNEDKKLFWSGEDYKQVFVDYNSGEVELEKSEEDNLENKSKEENSVTEKNENLQKENPDDVITIEKVVEYDELER